MSKKKCRSDVLQSVHEAAADLRSISAIDKETMRRLDEGCSPS
jgi:DNA-binding transcriptional regulator YiaG